MLMLLRPHCFTMGRSFPQCCHVCLGSQGRRTSERLLSIERPPLNIRIMAAQRRAISQRSLRKSSLGLAEVPNCWVVQALLNFELPVSGRAWLPRNSTALQKLQGPLSLRVIGHQVINAKRHRKLGALERSTESLQREVDSSRLRARKKVS